MSDRRDFVRHVGALAISLPVLSSLTDLQRIGGLKVQQTPQFKKRRPSISRHIVTVLRHPSRLCRTTMALREARSSAP